MSLAGGMSQHGGANQSLFSGDPGLDTMLSEVCLGYSQSRLPFTSSTRVQAMESSREGRDFSVLWSVETASGDHITYCVVDSGGPLTGLNPPRREAN